MKMLAVKNFFSSSIIYYNLLQTPNWVCHHHLLSLVIVFTLVLFWFQSFSRSLNFTVQGVPKFRSSFWSKLYFYMKFLKDIYSLSSTCIQNFNNWYALFIFLSHSVAVAAWSGMQRVDPQMIHFGLFYHLVRGIQFNPQTIFVSFRQLKKIYFGHSYKKDNHRGPHPQQGFCNSLQIWNELGVNWQTK